MGGNIFDGTRRYSKEEYNKLLLEISSLLKPLNVKFEVIQSYRNKDSFGDMDIIIGNRGRETIRFLFRDYPLSSNGHIDSYKFRDFQIDLIFIPLEDFETNYLYYCYSDFGNIIGRCFHKTGFKYGHLGLSFIVKDGDYQFKEIIVSKDHKKILEFLDYDYERFCQGFDTLEDIFRYAISTPYFNKEIYLLHNRNHTSRTRDRKRQTYRDFLVWIEKQTDCNKYPWPSFDERGGYKENLEWLEKAFIQFPGFEKEYHEVKKEFLDHLYFKSMFNGELVKTLTGLEGKRLGEFIQKLRTREDLKMFVLTSSLDELQNLIKEEYEIFCQ